MKGIYASLFFYFNIRFRLLPAPNPWYKKYSWLKNRMLFLLCFTLITSLCNKGYANVTLTSSSVVATNLNQGTSNNVVYITKMVVTTTAVGSSAATFAAPHAYSITINRAMAVGSTGYFILVVNVNSTGTINNTVKVNGATSPIVFGFTTAPNIVNTQTDAAGVKTIHAAALMLTSVTAASNNSLPINNRADLTNDAYGLAYGPGEKLKISTIGKGVSIYPNPVVKNTQFNLEFQNLQKDAYIITIFNSLGQQVQKQIIEHGGGRSVQKIRLQKIAAGMYTIQVRNQNMQFVKKLIVD